MSDRTAAFKLGKTTMVIAAALSVTIAACGKSGEGTEGGDAEKKAHEAAANDLKEPIATISVYLPYIQLPKDADKYTPKRHADLDQSTETAANEIRFAANKARQSLEASSADATKDIQAALKTVTTTCADAQDPEALDKCGASVKALDGALEKAQAAAKALSAQATYPRVGPSAVTPAAQEGIKPFLKARGPTPNDDAYAKKRSDAAASVQDVMSACQAAANDASNAASAFEKAEEPIRLIAVKRKMSMDSQCHQLEQMDSLEKDVVACKKKPKKDADCKIVCGKAKGALDEGLPAAAFAPLEKEFADICDKR